MMVANVCGKMSGLLKWFVELRSKSFMASLLFNSKVSMLMANIVDGHSKFFLLPKVELLNLLVTALA